MSMLLEGSWKLGVSREIDAPDLINFDNNDWRLSELAAELALIDRDNPGGTYLRLPWRPLISVDGSTIYDLDDKFKGSTSEASFVLATWKLRTYLRLPWRPLISVDGSTIYDLDDKFKIVRHAESWDISALEAIGQIFTPSFGRPSE
ncbi:hypothetical protein TEA_007095 [Camellia sinensis var. sinensis]|uniref:Uncharacterized protein n=1 Tax=Camellia sinensis var. sinensis TaxID=542762 RepID=A0A4S4D252_CAMSN|nr:hypothetical protein TEA_007095 [Camellia sinensis var. sinensis]